MTRQEEIKSLISKRQRRLQKLKEKEALSGYSTDPSIWLEIEDIEAQIETLQAELRQLQTAPATTPQRQSPPAQPPSASQTTSVSPEALALREALTRRNLTLFIGTDLSPTVTGLPSRTDLAHDLARRHRLDESLPLSEVAQRVSQAGNRWAFTDFIRTALDTTNKSPQPFHQQIATLVKTHQLETVITIAYDNLLELAFQQVGLGLNRVVRGSDVNFINPDQPTLIKLYGDAQQPDTLIVTDQDHSNLLRDREREAIIDEVRRAFRRNTVLFLGYNLADPDFRFIFDQIAASRFARTAYAVWPALPQVDVQMWRDRGIVILEADPLGMVDQIAPTSSNELLGEPEEEILPQSAQPESLEDELIIRREKNGRPYNIGRQWFIRLEVESKKVISNCQGSIRNIQRLYSPERDISCFQFSILSWADGMFNSISITPHKLEYLDLVWRAIGDPPFPQDELRVASAREQGKRDAKLWGMSQDFIPLKPGHYLLEVQIKADGYSEPVKRFYRLHWPGSSQEDNIRLTETDSPDSQLNKKGEGEPIPEKIYSTGNHWAVPVGGSISSPAADKTSNLEPGKRKPSVPNEQPVDFAIITALPKEAQAIVNRLENHTVKRFETKSIRTYHYGTIPIQNTDQEYRVALVLLPTLGNVSAANAVTDTITHWTPRFVLMVGIASGIPQDDLDLGDVVVADQIVGYDYGKMTAKGIKPQDRVYPVSALLLDRIHNFWDHSWTQQINIPRPENATRPASKLFVGPIASGNKVVASTKFRQQLTKHWPKLLGLEMESEGVFAAAFDRPQIPATLVIRGICDLADERKSDTWQEYAANAAAAYAISFIKSGPVDPQGYPLKARHPKGR